MRALTAVAPLLALAACTPAPPHVVAPAPVPVVAPPPATLAPAPEGRRAPETPGTWRYVADPAGSSARFGLPGAAPVFTITCRAADKQVALARAGSATGPMTVTTSYGVASWPAGATAEGITVLLAPRDGALDRIAFSRGRFTVAVAGLPDLILPAWAEPARVIEDCRG